MRITEREYPKFICISEHNNQIILGTYKNIYSYDLTTFEQKKNLSLNQYIKKYKVINHRDDEEISFITNQQKNKIYFFAQFNQSNIAIFIISLKYIELLSIFEFEDDFTIKLNPHHYHLLRDV